MIRATKGRAVQLIYINGDFDVSSGGGDAGILELIMPCQAQVRCDAGHRIRTHESRRKRKRQGFNLRATIPPFQKPFQPSMLPTVAFLGQSNSSESGL